MAIKYAVVWDNGANACGTFSDRFDTEEEAEAWGNEWADECNLRDFGTTEPDGDCYTFDVVEVDEPTDDEKDAHEGADHERMARECKP